MYLHKLFLNVPFLHQQCSATFLPGPANPAGPERALTSTLFSCCLPLCVLAVNHAVPVLRSDTWHHRREIPQGECRRCRIIPLSGENKVRKIALFSSVP